MSKQSEQARPDPAPMKAKMSMPEAEKGKMATHVRTVPNGGTCDGLVAPGGDPHGYLGHFRNTANLERGHNVGAPGDPMTQASVLPGGAPTPPRKPVFDPVTAPVHAARAANRAAIAGAREAGGDVAAVRAQNKTRMTDAWATRHTRNEMGLRKSDTQAFKAAKRAVRVKIPGGLGTP